MKILIAEDDGISCRLLDRTLTQWGYDPLVVCDGYEAWKVLRRRDAPRLAILDWMMPRLDGVQVCRLVRRYCHDAYIYILLLTARAHQEDLVEGMQAGADDYLNKPFDRTELQVRLQAGRRIPDLQEELSQACKTLKELATHDSLTGLWNRRAILEQIEQELARREREQSPLGILIADIDHFKQINDTYGHLVGDAVLRNVARRLHDTVRPYDSVGRYGGEEFLIVLPSSGSQSAACQAERLRAAVDCQPVAIPGGVVRVAISIGVTATIGARGIGSDAPIQIADSALYRAKELGRNRVELLSFPEEVACQPTIGESPVSVSS